MPLELGSIIEERYEVLRTVRSGGMGAIYEARDLRLPDAPCAVKEMLEGHTDGSASSETIRRKFAEEVRFLSTLHHPGIPRVRDFFVRDVTCYIVMDFIQGQDLEDELKVRQGLTGEPDPPEQVVKDMIAVLEVLEYLHAQDPPVVHRDVKPANIIRESKDGRVRLVDFGLARNVKGGNTTQTSVGTLAYCPVEQIQGRAEPRSDLYAVGATMVHLLTGEEPAALNVPVLAEDFPEAVEPELAAIVDRAAAFDAGDRFATATEMKQALQGWLARRQGGPAPAAPPPLVRTGPIKPAPGRAPSVVQAAGTDGAAVDETAFEDLLRQHEATERAAPTVVMDSKSFTGALVLLVVVVVGGLVLLSGILKPKVEPKAQEASPAVAQAAVPGGPPAVGTRREQPARRPVTAPVGQTPVPERTVLVRETIRERVVPSTASSQASAGTAPIGLPTASYAKARPSSQRVTQAAAATVPPAAAPVSAPAPPQQQPAAQPPPAAAPGPPLPPFSPPPGWRQTGSNVVEKDGCRVTLTTQLGQGSDGVHDGGRRVIHTFVGMGGPVAITATLEGPGGSWMDEIARWVMTLGPSGGMPGPGGGGMPPPPGGMGPPGGYPGQ